MDEKYRLIVFDLYDTIADKETNELLSGVDGWFDVKRRQVNLDIAIVTNQSDVGLRYWMETGEFGNPSKHPTEEDFWHRITDLYHKLPSLKRFNHTVYACFACQNQSTGKWGPIKYWKPEWFPEWSKPNTGMLRAAMYKSGVNRSEMLMVGADEKDKQAAENFGCHFMWADSFFSRNLAL